MIPTNVKSFPDIGSPSSFNIGLIPSGSTFTSDIQGARQDVELAASATWRISVSYNFLTGDRADRLEAFLIGLNGTLGRFWFGDLSRLEPSGTLGSYSGTPTALNTSRGNMIDINIATHGTLNAGSMLALYTEYETGKYTQSLHKVLNSTTASASYLRNVEIEPAIRRQPKSGTNPLVYLKIDTSSAIDRQNAVTTFALASRETSWPVIVGGNKNFTIDMVEVFT